VARRDRSGRKIRDALDLVAQYIQIVKNEYEMYFMGIQRIPPIDKERALKRMFRDLMEMHISNTAQLFKLRVLRARYNTLGNLWRRSLKQIEEGTYRKHRFMAAKREAGTAAKVKDAQAVKEEIRALLRGETVPPASAVAAKDKEEPRARPAKPAPKTNGHSAGSAELALEYAAVRKSLGMEGRVSASALEARLRKHAEIVKQRTGAREVRFRVVAENGKPRLKAIAIK
jgi:hypothetical protein